MTPMYIQMACFFCKKPLPYHDDHAGRNSYHLYFCKNCQQPDHRTMHRQLYRKEDASILLMDMIRIDEWFITRYHQPTPINTKHNYSKVFKEAIGVFENSPDMEPITFNKEACIIDRIIDLPWDNISLAKRKLGVWTTFS